MRTEIINTVKIGEAFPQENLTKFANYHDAGAPAPQIINMWTSSARASRDELQMPLHSEVSDSDSLIAFMPDYEIAQALIHICTNQVNFRTPRE